MGAQAALAPARIASLIKSGTTCNADLISLERGLVDGRDAIDVTQKEGFAPKSIVFLDIERRRRCRT